MIWNQNNLHDESYKDELVPLLPYSVRSFNRKENYDEEEYDPFVEFNEDLAEEYASKQGLTVAERVKKDQEESARLDKISAYKPVTSIDQIPPPLQRKIRNMLNIWKEWHKIISYIDINPLSPYYDKKKANLILVAYNRSLEEKKEKILEEIPLQEEVEKVKKYRPSKLKKVFSSIPKEVASEITQWMGLSPKALRYTTGVKQQIVALFNLNY